MSATCKRGQKGCSPRPSASSKAKSSSINLKSQQVCPICDDIILDDTKNQKAHDSIWCDGECNTWLHRGCAGLSKKKFLALKNSDDPFLCVSCHLSAHSTEIYDLRNDLCAMKDELSQLKSLISNNVHAESSKQKPYAAVVGNPGVQINTVNQPSVATADMPTTHIAKLSRFANSHTSADRKFNVVVSGIPECRAGLSPRQRWISDVNQISALFSKSSLAIQSSSILDCHRLGKFSPTQTRPRQILVHFNSCTVVMNILSNRSSFSPYLVKPDLSPEECATDRILMKQRWELLQSGTAKSSIKVKKNSLFVDGSLHGQVKDSTYIKHSAGPETVTADSSDTEPNTVNVGHGVSVRQENPGTGTSD